MKKLIFILFFSGIIYFLKPKDNLSNIYSFSGQTMGTSYSISISSISKLNITKIKSEVDLELKEVNRQMSTYINSSEISTFNNLKSLNDFKISRGFYKVLKKAKEIYEITEGIFDPTISPVIDYWGFGAKENKTQLSLLKKKVGFEKLILKEGSNISKKHIDLELNLSAIAKGYGVDRVSNLLSNYSLNNLVEIGGEVRAMGEKYPNKAWRVGIETPNFEKQTVLNKIVELKDQCVASSGNYRNFKSVGSKNIGHIIDPRTLNPSNNKVLASTVFSETCLEADALATSLMIGGEQLLRKIKSMKNVSGLLMLSGLNNKFKEINF